MRFIEHLSRLFNKDLSRHLAKTAHHLLIDNFLWEDSVFQDASNHTQTYRINPYCICMRRNSAQLFQKKPPNKYIMLKKLAFQHLGYEI